MKERRVAEAAARAATLQVKIVYTAWGLLSVLSGQVYAGCFITNTSQAKRDRNIARINASKVIFSTTDTPNTTHLLFT